MWCNVCSLLCLITQCACTSTALMDKVTKPVQLCLLTVFVCDRCRNRIDQKDLLVERPDTLMAKNWVDGSGLNHVTQYTQETVDSMKRIIMDDQVSGMFCQQSHAHGRVALQIPLQTHTMNYLMPSDYAHCFQILCHWRRCSTSGLKTQRSQNGLLCVAQTE